MRRFKGFAIYCIENLVNGKKYIGQTKRGSERRWDHYNKLKKRKHENRYLQNAWNKYGEDNFKFYFIEKDILTREDADSKEQYYIKEWNTFVDDGFGYNLDHGGSGGPEPSESTRKKMSDAKIGKEPWNKGKQASEELKETLSLAHKGKPSSRKGIKLSTEAIQKISERMRGKPSWNKGKTFSEESKRKMSESKKGKVAYNRGRKMGNNTSSKYVGVSQEKQYGRWVANISCEGEHYYLGCFATETEAALAYNEAALEFFGWKAKLNDIPQSEIEALWDDDILISENYGGCEEENLLGGLSS